MYRQAPEPLELSASGPFPRVSPDGASDSAQVAAPHAFTSETSLSSYGKRVILRPVIMAKGAFSVRRGLLTTSAATLLALLPCFVAARSVSSGAHPGAPVARRTAEFEALPLLRSRQNHL